MHAWKETDHSLNEDFNTYFLFNIVMRLRKMFYCYYYCHFFLNNRLSIRNHIHKQLFLVFWVNHYSLVLL